MIGEANTAGCSSSVLNVCQICGKAIYTPSAGGAWNNFCRCSFTDEGVNTKTIPAWKFCPHCGKGLK